MYIYIFYCTSASGVHVQNMQDYCIGSYMAMWFAASINPSSTLGISPTAIPPLPPDPCYPSPIPRPTYRPWCVMFSLCPCVLIVQLPLMSENMQWLVFCSWVSLLRMMVSSFIHFPAKDMNSFFFMLHCIPWCICVTFSLLSLSLMDIWVGSKSLLLWTVLQ